MKEVSKQEILNTLEPMLNCQNVVSILVNEKVTEGVKSVEVLWYDNTTNDLISSAIISNLGGYDEMFMYVVTVKYDKPDINDYWLTLALTEHSQYSRMSGSDFKAGFTHPYGVENSLKSYTDYLVRKLN